MSSEIRTTEITEFLPIETEDIQLPTAANAAAPLERIMFGDTITEEVQEQLLHLIEAGREGDHARHIFLATLPNATITALSNEKTLAAEENRPPRHIDPKQILEKIRELRNNKYIMTTMFSADDQEEIPYLGYKSGGRRYYPELRLPQIDELGVIEPVWKVVMRSEPKNTLPADIAIDETAVSTLRSFSLRGDCSDILEYTPPEKGQTEGVVRLKNISVIKEEQEVPQAA